MGGVPQGAASLQRKFCGETLLLLNLEKAVAYVWTSCGENRVFPDWNGIGKSCWAQLIIHYISIVLMIPSIGFSEKECHWLQKIDQQPDQDKSNDVILVNRAPQLINLWCPLLVPCLPLMLCLELQTGRCLNDLTFSIISLGLIWRLLSTR